MKRIICVISLLLLVLNLSAQTLHVVVGNTTYMFPATQAGEMNYTDGSTLTIVDKSFTLADVSRIYVDDSEVTDNTVQVSYSGSSASVKVSGNIAKYIVPTISGAHVKLVQSEEVDDNVGEITYNLTGTSTDGEFYMEGSYKATIELDGITLTNVTPVYSGAAVHIQNGKRINVKVITGTENTLVDAASGSQKGALYIKGHAEFKQKGTLNVTGNLKHAIKTGEYFSLKNATINVLGAAGGDGINCAQYFLMESGSLHISNPNDDGIQVDLDGDTSTGETTDHEDEDSGNAYINGGTITVNSSACGSWDSDDNEAKGTSCLNADGDITITSGTVTMKATGSGGRGIKCDGIFTTTGGTVDVTTTGALYYNNGTTENKAYTGNTDNISSDYYCAAKGIKAGDSDTSTGGIVISGGTINVTTSGYNAEGIESKNTIEVNGGYVTVNSYDDGINSSQDMTFNGGYVYARSTNNDGIDANGNLYIKGGLIFANGSSSPELAVDANSESQKKIYLTGGTLVAIGGLESGASLSQSCYSTSSWSKNTWYAMTYGSTTFAFKTPSSGGTTMVVSASSTPTLKSGVTVSGGTEIFGGAGVLDASVSGGSTVSLSNYSSNGQGGFGGNTGGGPKGW